MRSTSLIVAVSLGLALVACKKTEATNVSANDTSMTTDTNSMMTDTNSPVAAPAVPALAAQAFTDTIVGSDMFEIQSGKLAETMGSTAAVKAFGKTLVTDHTKSSEMLKSAAGKTSPTVALPVLLPADLKAKLAALKAAKGADFDKLFVEQQTEGHQKALDVLTAYASGGDQESLKSFAATAAPVVEGHLTQLKAMPK